MISCLHSSHIHTHPDKIANKRVWQINLQIVATALEYMTSADNELDDLGDNPNEDDPTQSVGELAAGQLCQRRWKPW